MRVAYVHDWLVTYRGGEKVLEALMELYPDAPVYTLFYDKEKMPKSLQKRRIIYPKWLQPLKKFRKQLLPILPMIVESFPLEDYDLVISSSSCVAKGVMVGPNTKHISYIHSPMRYVWDQRGHYIHQKGRLLRPIIHVLSTLLRMWDVGSAARIDRMIANSHFIASRIRRYYDKEASVIHPPIEIASKEGVYEKKGYFLAAGAFVPYKGFDLAIKACEKEGKRLIIAGSGEDEARLRQLAGPNTSFIISPDDELFSRLLHEADALLFPGVEDFGMIAIEAMACGTPVIALQGGGALDFIVPYETGVFFKDKTVTSLGEAIKSFESGSYDQGRLKDFAKGFSKDVFQDQFKKQLKDLLKGTSK